MSSGASPVMSNFPFGFGNGVSLRNVPVVTAQGGQVFWVYNGSNVPPGGRGGADGNPGTFLSPLSTIAAAVDKCVASRGDIIFVKPGHAETVTAVSLLALDVAGISLVGIGNGANRPTLTVGGATTATITVSAANVRIENFIIDLRGIDAIASGITATGTDFQFVNNFVNMADGSSQAVLGMTLTTSTRSVISGNYFIGTPTAGTTAAIQLVSGDRVQITDNVIQGNFTAGTGCVSNITNAALELLIAGNVLGNGTASSTKVITCVAGTTGFIANNRMQILSGTAPITAAGMSWVGANYYANAVATAGTLI